MSAHRLTLATLAFAVVAGIIAGILDPAQIRILHAATVLAGAAMVAETVRETRLGSRRTWVLLCLGTTLSTIALDGARFAHLTPPIAGLVVGGYMITWLGIWLVREQRVSGGRATFVLEVSTTVLMLCMLASIFATVIHRPFRDDSELVYMYAACVAGMLAASIPVIVGVGGSPFCRRDRFLTASMLTGFISTVLLTAALRRGLGGTHLGLALSGLQLPLMAVAAASRPGVAGIQRLGTWWEWVPPSVWMVLGSGALLAGRWIEFGTGVALAATAVVMLALARFVLTVREIGRTVLHRHTSLTDDLTGLPNRHMLFHDLDLLTHSRGTSGESATLIVIGIDGFRQLNDTLGHQAGDTLLRSVSERLAHALGHAGQLMRLAGDEFAVVVRRPADASAVSSALDGSFESVFEVESINVALRASIGMASYPEDAIESAELARRAEVAMTDAKRRRIGIVSYAAEQDADAVTQLALADELRQALSDDDGGLWVGFQPQLNVSDGSVHGAEALVRWRHPARGYISPAQLLPIAERNGLLTPLTDWMLEQTISAAARLGELNGTELRFAVNVSAATLVDVRLPDRIEQTLRRHGVMPRQLVVEVTEDAVMSDEQRCLEVLEAIAALGVEIAIDDFGTGHSSLSQLRNLPAQELKIDRSFVQEITVDLLDAEIVRLIVRMGRQIGMRVVAEGVETNIERRMLADFGCNVVQGFGIGRPMPFEDLVVFLDERRVTAPARTGQRSWPDQSAA